MKTDTETSPIPSTLASSTDYARIVRATLISLGISTTISVGEYCLYLLTGSLALKADAFHSGSDVLASGLVLGNALWLKGQYPRVERICGLIMAVLIFGAALEAILEASRPVHSDLRHLGWAVVAVIAVVVVIHCLARYKTRVGREEQYRLLVSEGRHTHMDQLSSLVVLASLIGKKIGVRLDAPAAVIVAVLMLITGFSVLREHVFQAGPGNLCGSGPAKSRLWTAGGLLLGILSDVGTVCGRAGADRSGLHLGPYGPAGFTRASIIAGHALSNVWFEWTRPASAAWISASRFHRNRRARPSREPNPPPQRHRRNLPPT